MLDLIERSNAIAVARGASYLTVQKVVFALSRAVAFVFLARMISVAEMGLLTILSAGMALVQAVTGLGLANVTTKLIAENIARGKARNAAAVFYVSLALTITMSFVAAAAILLLRFPAATSHELRDTSLLSSISLLLALDIVFNAGIYQTTNISMIGLQKFRELTAINVGYIIARQVLVLLLVFLWQSFVGLVAAWVISDVLVSAVMLTYVAKRLGQPTFTSGTKHLLKLSTPLLIGNLWTFAYNWFDRLLLIGSVNLTALGVYGAATEAFGAYSTVIGVLPMVLLPAFAETQVAKGSEALRSAAKAASRYISYAAIPIAFGLFATARPAMTLFVGQSYEEGAIPLAVMVAFSTATIVTSALAPILIVLEQTTLAALTIIIPVIASVGLAWTSIPVLGIVGASAARGLAMVLNLVFTVVFLRRRFPVELDVGAIVKSIVGGLAMVGVIALVQLQWYSRFLLPLYLFTGVVAYLFVLRILRAANMEDINLLRHFLGPRFDAVVNVLSAILRV